MSEAPERCIDCLLTPPSVCSATTATDDKTVHDIYPGPSCPFNQLDAANVEIQRRDGEIRVLKNQLLRAEREAWKLSEILDENGIEYGGGL